MNQIDRNNNFDLIRLLAAIQVAVYHAIIHFKIDTPLIEFLKHFPGVPVFFALSGFLISMSYQNSKGDIKRYFHNRFLRIYPALWVCFLITIILLFAFNALYWVDLDKITFWTWVLAQLSCFQFYDNALVQDWGIGSPNGSLWSIAVELQFYVFVPILFWILSKLKTRWLVYLFFGILFFFSIFFEHIVSNTVWWFCVNVEGTPKIFLNYVLLNDVLGIILFSNLHFFLFGIILYLKKDTLSIYLKNSFWPWFSIYIIYVLVFYYGFESYNLASDKSILGLFSGLILVMLSFSAAFTNTTLSKKILYGNDISYGVYIYHMLVINSIYGFVSGYVGMFLTLFITIICAYLSWKFIEVYFIKLKQRQQRP